MLWKPVFAQINLRECVIKIKDGTANELQITVGEGNLTYSEQKQREYTLDRGSLDEVRNGDAVPMDVSFEFTWKYIKGLSSTGTGFGTVGSGESATPTVEDALKQRGNAADWTSSDSDTCRPYAVDIEITYTPDCSIGDKEVITLADFRYEQIDHDLGEGTISCTGKCNAEEPIVVRSSQT